MYLVWYKKQSENHKGTDIMRNIKITRPKPPYLVNTHGWELETGGESKTMQFSWQQIHQ